MERHFTILVERDPETDWLVGEVKELPGCFTEAPDLPTLKANIWEAITGYLKVVEPGASVYANHIEDWRIEAAG